MKSIFEFDMNDQDDIIAHLRVTKSLSMALAIWSIVHNTKKSLSYSIESALNEDKNLNQFDVLEIVFDRIHEILEEHSININELIN